MKGFFSKKNLVLMIALFLFAVMAISAAGGKYDFPLAKTILTTVISPVDSALTGIGSAVNKAGQFVGSIMSTYEENQTLKKEISELRRANIGAAEIWAENKRLRDLLSYKQENNRFILVPARVVGFNPNGVNGNIIIDKGSKDGLERDMSVVTPDGLVGNIVDVYYSSARVQLLVHPKTAVGGIVQRPLSRVAGIVSGNASTPHTPNLLNLARDADIIKGDIILTSGFGGIYPKGVVIGIVDEVLNAEGGLLKYAVINPTVDFERLEEVLVITNKQNYTQELADSNEKDGAGQ